MDTQTRARDRGLTLLVAATIARLAMAVVYPVVYAVVRPELGSFDFVERILGIGSLGIDALAIFAWATLVRTMPPSQAGLAKGVIAILAIQLVPTFALEVLGRHALGGAWISPLWSLTFLAELLLGWFALLRLGDSATRASLSGMTRGVIILVGARALLLVARTAVVFQRMDLATMKYFYSTTHYVQIAASVIYAILVLVAVKRLRAVPVETGSEPSLPLVRQGHLAHSADPSADILWGAIMLAGGVIVTVASYSMTRQAGGGRYIFTTGLIGVGLGRLIRGLLRR